MKGDNLDDASHMGDSQVGAAAKATFHILKYSELFVDPLGSTGSEGSPHIDAYTAS